MANLTPTPGGFSPNVRQLETTDAALAGPTGVMNVQGKQFLANELALKDWVDSARFRAVGTARAVTTSSGPWTMSELDNGAISFFFGPNSEFNLVNITGSDDYPDVPETFPSGKLFWTRIICHENIGLVINKPIGMVLHYSGVQLSSGDADDAGSAAVVYSVNNAVVDIYVKDNVAIVTSNMPSNAPGFKTGMMVKYGTVSAVVEATWWLSCDGSAVSRSTYAELFAVIGTAYGAGNGTTTFNLPNEPTFMIRHRDSY